MKIILKPHPANRMDINKYKKHDLDIEITYNALDLLLDKCDIAFSSCSTAAAVDTYLSGKKTLIMIDPGMFNMSPLRGFLGVEYIYTSSDLLSSLQDMGQAKHEEYTDFFYVNDDLSRWKNIIN